MERRGPNKENKKPGRNMSIKDAFRVKKCLFEPTKLDFALPKLPDPAINESPTSHMEVSHVESPFALFQIKKRRTQTTYTKSLHDSLDITPQKRFSSVAFKEEQQQYSKEESAVTMVSATYSNSVKLAVQKAMTDSSLTGNFSKQCVLPTIEGRHPDLKTITPETVADLLNEVAAFPMSFKIIDCRYPYEYDAGHIKSAVNIYNKGIAEEDFFTRAVTSCKQETAHILIFYCEFSSERAPGMYRFLRNQDRDLNKDCYPFLYYPELYVLEGGYKAFYSSFKALCEPQDYKPMLHKDNADDLVHYRQLCKTWSLKSKKSKRAKMQLQFKG